MKIHSSSRRSVSKASPPLKLSLLMLIFLHQLLINVMFDFLTPNFFFHQNILVSETSFHFLFKLNIVVSHDDVEIFMQGFTLFPYESYSLIKSSDFACIFLKIPSFPIPFLFLILVREPDMRCELKIKKHPTLSSLLLLLLLKINEWNEINRKS